MVLARFFVRRQAVAWRLARFIFAAGAAVFLLRPAATTFANACRPPHPVVRTAVENRALTGQFMFPVASKEVWEHARRLVAELGFKAEKRKDSEYVLVSKWRRYDQRRFPTAAQLELPPHSRPTRLQLHLSSAHRLEPARLAIGVLLETQNADGRVYRWYSAEAFERWFLDQLSARVGAPWTPLPATWEARIRQADRLRPAGLASPCPNSEGIHARTPPRLKALGSDGAVHPEVLSEVRPVFPRDTRDGPAKRVLLLEAVVTEHGTTSDLRLLDGPADSSPLDVSARGAVSLWRFQPALVHGCPVPVVVEIELTYVLK
jgi:hypothetical protein